MKLIIVIYYRIIFIFLICYCNLLQDNFFFKDLITPPPLKEKLEPVKYIFIHNELKRSIKIQLI